jgi:hypothetical protein
VFAEVVKFKLLQVYPMYEAFIEPDLKTAHIKIINKFNPFTGFQSPTYILKVSSNVAHLMERKKWTIILVLMLICG